MESTLLLLILIVLAEALLPGGIRRLALHALAASALCAIVVAVVGGIAYVAPQSSRPWSAAALILMGFLYVWIAAEWAWKRIAAWKGRRNGVEREP